MKKHLHIEIIISMYSDFVIPQNVVKSDDCIVYAELGQVSKVQRPAVPIGQGCNILNIV